MQPVPDLSAPLADAEHARLELPGGVYHLRLRSLDTPATDRDPYRDPPDLFRARFDGPVPQVAVHDGTVRIHYPRFRFFRSTVRSGEIALAPSLPWTIAVSGGSKDLHGDLRKLVIEGITISGGVSVVRLLLPRPRGRCTIVITGGVNRVELLRPAVVPVRLLATGGIRDLRVDDLALNALGGRFAYHTPGHAENADAYDVSISGGVTGLTILGDALVYAAPAGPVSGTSARNLPAHMG